MYLYVHTFGLIFDYRNNNNCRSAWGIIWRHRCNENEAFVPDRTATRWSFTVLDDLFNYVLAMVVGWN